MAAAVVREVAAADEAEAKEEGAVGVLEKQLSATMIRKRISETRLWRTC